MVTSPEHTMGGPAVVNEDDKKKFAIQTSYDGFNIYGKILCLIVRRKGVMKLDTAKNSGPAMMEDWIASTQAIPDL